LFPGFVFAWLVEDGFPFVVVEIGVFPAADLFVLLLLIVVDFGLSCSLVYIF
jgi:hypothetical protein